MPPASRNRVGPGECNDRRSPVRRRQGMTMRKMLLAAPLLLAPGLAEAQSSYNPNLVRGVYIAAGAGVNWLNDTPIAATGQLADSLALSGRSLSGDVSYDMGWVGVI